SSGLGRAVGLDDELGVVGLVIVPGGIQALGFCNGLVGVFHAAFFQAAYSVLGTEIGVDVAQHRVQVAHAVIKVDFRIDLYVGLTSRVRVLAGGFPGFDGGVQEVLHHLWALGQCLVGG